MGKSSIGEAIAWAITGCDINGNEKATARHVNDKKPKLTEVVLDFEIDGTPQTLIRRKKGSSNEIYLNDVKVTNNDISKDLYKSKDVFLSILNPYYFPNLAPKDAKNLLSSILKPISKEEIFAELGDFLKEKLEKNKFRTPETFLTDKRAELKDQEENIIFLEGVIEGAKPIDISERKSFDNTELKNLKEQLKTLESVIKDPKFDELENKKRKLQLELSKGYFDVKPINDTKWHKAEKDSLLKRFKEIKAKISNLGKNVVTCDNCGNEIDLNATLKANLEKELKDIQIKGVAKKKEIEEWEKENEITKAENAKVVQEWEIGLKYQIEAIQKEISELAAEKSKEEESRKEKITSIKAKVLELDEEERRIFAHNSNIEALEKQNEKIKHDIEKSKREIENSKLKIAELKVAIDAGKQYNSIKLKKQTEIIGKYLDKVELQFEKLTKDGELKDDFKILYEGREFNKLSNAEKIKAGLEMSNFVSNMMDLHFPVFIDNAESITVIRELDTQMIMAKVVEGRELKVEVLK
ncbi:AAA family ATPase [Clostridium pasteurianum]|uniref:AAA family ATPase n=1 Tax=Clostridium pasteurianum TaxID=1501 RepID=UPI003D6D0896